MSAEPITLEALSKLIATSHFPPLLDEHQAAAMTGFSVWWFRDHRRLGTGPKHILVPPRSIRYDRDELLAWFRQYAVKR